MGLPRRASGVCGSVASCRADRLTRALTDARRPMLAVVGGSKVSTKLQVLDSLTERCDSLIVEAVLPIRSSRRRVIR